jgi:hypothetical protein
METCFYRNAGGMALHLRGVDEIATDCLARGLAHIFAG